VPSDIGACQRLVRPVGDVARRMWQRRPAEHRPPHDHRLVPLDIGPVAARRRRDDEHRRDSAHHRGHLRPRAGDRGIPARDRPPRREGPPAGDERRRRRGARPHLRRKGRGHGRPAGRAGGDRHHPGQARGGAGEAAQAAADPGGPV
ncbi:MAG: hypothetical protein AVDCRST_MAG76-597, partial [uncultured Acidimicrobiales bacterium]